VSLAFDTCLSMGGHRELLRQAKTYNVKGLGQGSRSFSLNLTQPRLQKFHKISDIGLLDNGCYGMPYTSNFPIIDAVILPDILLQYCTGMNHKGAFNSLESIRDQLHEKNRKKHKMIFINDHKKFGKQDKLGDIKQYLMSYNHVD